MAKGWSFGALVAALKDTAFKDIGTTAGTVAAGDDSRITGAMQKANNGSDIPNKAAFWSVLGGQNAGQRSVGSGANQIPDINFFNTGNRGSFRMPDGHIVQFDSGPSYGGGFTKSYPTPFPNQCQALIGVVYGGLGTRVFVTANTSDRTAANLNAVDQNGNGVNVTLGYIAIGF